MSSLSILSSSVVSSLVVIWSGGSSISGTGVFRIALILSSGGFVTWFTLPLVVICCSFFLYWGLGFLFPPLHPRDWSAPCTLKLLVGTYFLLRLFRTLLSFMHFHICIPSA